MAGKPVLISIGSEFDAKGIAEAQRQLSNLEKNLPTGKLAEMGMKFQAVGAKMQAVGKSLTKNVTLPIVAIGTAATAAFIEFDNSMTKITSLVGIATEEVDGMRSAVISMATATGKSAAEAADALFFITSAGLRGKDAMDVLDMSLKASAIGLGETKVIADLATSAMNAYGSSTLNATQATDVLAAAVREGKLEPAELAQAMGQVLPIASNLGVSFNEVGAAFAGMSRTGTNASQAATQLRGILNSLLKPTKQAETQLAAMGLSSEGLRRQLREEGLLSVLTTLKDSFGDNEAAVAKVFGNVRALTGVMDLMGANVEDNIGIFNRMTDVTGMTNEGFETVSQTAGFKLKEAFNSLKNSLIEFGAIIAPVVADVAKFFTGMAQAFDSLSPKTKEMIVRFAAIAAAIGPALLIGGKFISLIGSMIILLPKLGAALTLATGPIGLIIAAVAALVAGIVLLYKNNEDFRNFVHQVWAEIGNFIGTVVGMVRKFLDDNRESIEKLKEAFSTIASFLSTYVAPIIQALIRFQLQVMITVIRALIAGVTVAIEIFMSFASAITNVIGTIAKFVSSVVSGLSQAANSVSSFGATVRKQFDNAINLLFNAGRDIVMGLWNGLQSMTNWLVSKVTDWIKSVLPDPIERILGIRSPSRKGAEIGKNFVAGLSKGLDENIGMAVDSSRSIASGIGDQTSMEFAKVGALVAINMIQGLIREISPQGSMRRNLMQMMDSLARSLNRTSTVTVVTRRIEEGGGGGGAPSPAPEPPPGRIVVGPGITVPLPPAPPVAPPGRIIVGPGISVPMAKGGIVTQPIHALIGEAGPEAVIPLNRANGMMGNTYNIVVNPGLSTDAETGRAVVEAIRRYERTSGQIFANA